MEMEAAIMISIGEFSKICHVTTRTLRHYDDIGLLKPIHINEENNYVNVNISYSLKLNRRTSL